MSSYEKCTDFPINFPQCGKCNKKPMVGKSLENTHTFLIVWVLFSHWISILWYTSSYGKCMGFPSNFSQYRKMQQNPSYWENLGNWSSYFSYNMGASFPLDSHFMVYFITWEVHVFSHQFPITWEKRQPNPSNREILGDWVPAISYKTHPMLRTWEISIHTFPILWVLFSIRFSSYGILHQTGNAWVSSSNFPLHQKSLRNPSNRGKAWEIGSHTFSIRWVLLSIRLRSCGILHHVGYVRFSHQFGIAWDKAGKPIRWEKFAKMIQMKILQNPSYVENLGNWQSYFSYSKSAIFPLESHPAVYSIICEIHEFPHQYPIAWENAAKSIELEEPGKLVPIFP